MSKSREWIDELCVCVCVCVCVHSRMYMCVCLYVCIHGMQSPIMWTCMVLFASAYNVCVQQLYSLHWVWMHVWLCVGRRQRTCSVVVLCTSGKGQAEVVSNLWGHDVYIHTPKCSLRTWTHQHTRMHTYTHTHTHTHTNIHCMVIIYTSFTHS